MKVAIVGSAASTKDNAPFDDPEWEIWGMAWRSREMPRVDRVFEMHAEELWADYANTELYAAWLGAPTPLGGSKEPPVIYVRPEVARKYKKTKAYPIKDAVKLMGCEYFASSFAYALAMAINEGAEEIALYGIDLVADDEYAYQRPNAEYLLGIARGRGIKIHIPWQSALLKASWVYGAERCPESDPMKTYFQDKMAKYDKEIEDLEARAHILRGARHEAEEIVNAFTVKQRGALGGGS